MAAPRRGKFGYRPKAAPDLSATLVSIARQMQNAEEQNIVDAWKNGGTFNGQRVTDDVIQKYWQGRLNGLDKSDPDYTKYQNTLYQYQYAIGESQMNVRYQQGKATDAQFAQFYLDWEKKATPGSEFYRTLQLQAAKFLNSEKAKGAAGAAKAKTEAYNAFKQGVLTSSINPGVTMTAWLTQIARENSIIGQNEDLSKLAEDQNDPGRLLQAVSLLNAAIKADPTKYAALIADYKQGDPAFTGQFTVADYQHALANQVKGWETIATRATADGYATEAKNANKAKDAATQLGIEATAMPVGQAYAIARQQYDLIVNNPSATDADKKDAADAFAAKLQGMANTPGLAVFMAKTLLNDAKTYRGDPNDPPAEQPSFNESWLGLKAQGTNVTTKGENATAFEDTSRISAFATAAQNNPGAYIYASSKKDNAGNPTFDPEGKGPVALVPTLSVRYGEGNIEIIPVATLTGHVILQAVSLRDVVVDDPNHPGAKGIVVGHAAVYNQGGVQKTIYGIARPDGTTDWTHVAPFNAGVTITNGSDGTVHLTPPPPDLMTTARAYDQKYGTDFASRIKSGTTTTTMASYGSGEYSNLKITMTNGHFTATTSVQGSAGRAETQTVDLGSEIGTPADAARLVWDGARLTDVHSGLDYGTLIAAATVSTGASSSDLTGLATDPNFNAAMVRQSGYDGNRLAANNDELKNAVIMASQDNYFKSSVFQVFRAGERKDLPAVVTPPSVTIPDYQPTQIKLGPTVTIPGIPAGMAGPGTPPVTVPGNPSWGGQAYQQTGFGSVPIGPPPLPAGKRPALNPNGQVSTSNPAPLPVSQPGSATPTPTPQPVSPTPDTGALLKAEQPVGIEKNRGLYTNTGVVNTTIPSTPSSARYK